MGLPRYDAPMQRVNRCLVLVLAVFLIGPFEGSRSAADKGEGVTAPKVSIPGARATTTGLLVGGQPSDAQLRDIQKAGYRTVVSLRTSEEPGASGAREAVERLKMRFVSIPVEGAAGLTEDNARALGKALGAKGALPAVVYCASGQRASALLGLKAFVVDGASKKEAMELAKELGTTRLEVPLRERIEEICKRDPKRRCD